MPCDYCTDPDGEPCYPSYGVAPHITSWDSGETVLIPVSPFLFNFVPDPESPGHGTWYCPRCLEGMPQSNRKTVVQPAVHELVLEDISVERVKQITKGFSFEHDDKQDDRSLALCAQKILSLLDLGDRDSWTQNRAFHVAETHDYRQCLIVAAAMITAELERVDRAGKVNQPPDDEGPELLQIDPEKFM